MRASADTIAFYGTLMDRAGSFYGLDSVGEVTLRGDLYDVHGAYPALVPGDGDVRGQAFRLPSDDRLRCEVLGALDQYEGYREHDPEGSLYLRRDVELADGTTAQAYVWNKGLSGLERIPSGDWRDAEPAWLWGRQQR